jgi:hypothetical protein
VFNRSTLCPKTSQYACWSDHDLANSRPPFGALRPALGYGLRYLSPVRTTNFGGLSSACGATELGINQGSWRKASHSVGNGECIEVADGPVGRVAVRDSKSPASPALVYSVGQWKSFLTKISI